jgi:hypothetical protein
MKRAVKFGVLTRVKVCLTAGQRTHFVSEPLEDFEVFVSATLRGEEGGLTFDAAANLKETS